MIASKVTYPNTHIAADIVWITSIGATLIASENDVIHQNSNLVKYYNDVCVSV